MSTTANQKTETKMTPEQKQVEALMAALAVAAPSVAFTVEWSHHNDADWDIEEDLEMEREDFISWQTETKATAVVCGRLVTGSSYLGLTKWAKFGDDPSQSNPSICGYLNQNLDEAMDELMELTESLNAEIAAARKVLKEARA